MANSRPKAAHPRHLLPLLLLLSPPAPPPSSSSPWPWPWPWRRRPPPLARTATTIPPSFVVRAAAAVPTSKTTAGNLYAALGIPRDASSSDVKRAYRKMALLHHPDKVPKEKRHDAERKFKEIAKAYEWLGDDEKRKLYDRYGERSLEPNFRPGPFDGPYAGAGGGGGGGGGGARTFHFGDGGFPSGAFGGGMGGPSPFGGMGGGMGGMGGMGGFADVDLNEILRQMMGGAPPTKRGHGTGRTSDRRRRSTTSSSSSSSSRRGAGGDRQTRSSRRPPPRPPPRPVRCTLEELYAGCTKRLKVTYPARSSSSDIGVAKKREGVYEVRITPGTKDGTVIDYPADEEADMPAISFVIRESGHPYLVRDGDDLVWRCRLTPGQAERGARLKLPLPDGTVVEIVSRGGTRSGERTRVSGRGMPSSSSGGGEDGDGDRGRRGDVVIEFVVE